MWGVHNDRPDLNLVENGFVSIGWPKMGDLREIGDDRDAIKQRIAERFPNVKQGAVPVWAGVLIRFAFEMKVGDYVLYPHKPDSTVNIGRVTGEYEYLPQQGLDADADAHPHRRSVEWICCDIPRATFTQPARYEIGSAVTMFRIKRNVAEFRARVEGTATPDVGGTPTEQVDEAVEQAEQAVNAERIESDTRDFIIQRLMTELTGYEFEEFTADLLRAMGYRAQVTAASGDGGIDVIAHRDPLGLEPPLIKVQCKRTESSKGTPDVQKLTGALSPGGSELGLFVSLGSYSKDAESLARSRSDLRLLGGDDVVKLIFEHYDKLDPKWQRLLPMRSVFVVDIDPEDG